MATGIAQKSYKALFPLWSLKKKDIGIGKNLDIETKKKVKLYLYYLHEFVKSCKIRFWIDLAVTINACFNVT